MHDSFFRDKPRGVDADFTIAGARDSLHRRIDQTVDRARHGDVNALKTLRFLNNIAVANGCASRGCDDE